MARASSKARAKEKASFGKAKEKENLDGLAASTVALGVHGEAKARATANTMWMERTMTIPMHGTGTMTISSVDKNEIGCSFIMHDRVFLRRHHNPI
jgi:hypothetical protein